jgi:hypothetical protein
VARSQCQYKVRESKWEAVSFNSVQTARWFCCYELCCSRTFFRARKLNSKAGSLTARPPAPDHGEPDLRRRRLLSATVPYGTYLSPRLNTSSQSLLCTYLLNFVGRMSEFCPAILQVRHVVYSWHRDVFFSWHSCFSLESKECKGSNPRNMLWRPIRL